MMQHISFKPTDIINIDNIKIAYRHIDVSNLFELGIYFRIPVPISHGEPIQNL